MTFSGFKACSRTTKDEEKGHLERNLWLNLRRKNDAPLRFQEDSMGKRVSDLTSNMALQVLHVVSHWYIHGLDRFSFQLWTTGRILRSWIVSRLQVTGRTTGCSSQLLCIPKDSRIGRVAAAGELDPRKELANGSAKIPTPRHWSWNRFHMKIHVWYTFR